MLEALHIRNYILIDSLDITFPEGLVIITGQTGAGKSILLGALSLLMGAKADASVISQGADHCTVEADFESSDPLIEEILTSNDIEWDGGHMTIRRVVYSTGRSRSFVNDCPVQVGILSSISNRLVDIHSQHQSLLLSDHGFQLSVLDHFAGCNDILNDCRKAWKKFQSLSAECAAIEEQIARSAREKDYNEAQFAALDAAKLRAGELEELEAEQVELSNAEEIKDTLTFVGALLDSDSEGRPGVSVALKEAGKSLSRITRFVPAIPELAERLESARIEIDDIMGSLQEINERTDLSQERLETVEARMSLLYDLLKKHNCTRIEELIALRDELAEKLYDSDALQDKLETARKLMESAHAEYGTLSSELHKRRSAAAPSLSESILNSIHYLELDRAAFEVRLGAAAPGPDGNDSVCFAFAADGREPVDIAKCASGGELSRIMLCIKALMAKHTKMPTIIFDEIDTGVSGSVADKMGSMICSMGQDMQVMAITHLPQVAAKGQAHFMVSKEGAERVTSSIRKLSPEERVLEIARMLSGSQISPEAIANARSLIG